MVEGWDGVRRGGGGVKVSNSIRQSQCQRSASEMLMSESDVSNCAIVRKCYTVYGNVIVGKCYTV